MGCKVSTIILAKRQPMLAMQQSSLCGFSLALLGSAPVTERDLC